MEPWQWGEQTWRSAVQRVRAGRSQAPAHWPGDTAVAVALSFDADAETPWLRDGDTSPGGLSAGQFGHRVGTPRVLRLLEQYSVRSTFFFPGVAALLHPEEVRTVADLGHEIGAHGWIHERPETLGEADERALLTRTLDVLESACGMRPSGLRTPSFGFSAHTLPIAVDAGLSYDSSLMADDEPYELLLDGRPTAMIEIPVDWGRDDAAYFVMDRYSGVRPQPAPRDVLNAWRDEYRAARRGGGLFQLTLHPDLIGRRSRIVILEELLDEMASDRDVWFATHNEVAAHCRISCALPGADDHEPPPSRRSDHQ